MIKLPEIREGVCLDFEWFPTKAQCFIYRNWGLVTPEKMAEVLESETAVVLRMADEMGLDLSVEVMPEWRTRGYITLIRNCWHLLDYEQMCVLLDWTMEYLAFIIEEDDFLWYKMGRFKADSGHLRVEELDEEGKRRTAEIRRITKEIYAKVPQTAAKPFDFFRKTVFATGDAPEMKTKTRFLYSYCALYGDTFFDKKLIDVSFPDEMLRSYQSMGINGIWTQAVMTKLTPYEFLPELSEGYEQRLEGVRYLIEKLARYGMKLYLYINEPRTLPSNLLENRPDIRGHVHEEQGITSLCIRTEGVQKYLRESVAFLVKNAPGLGGFFTITSSENRTHCMSHVHDQEKLNCPHCKGHTNAENFALVNQLIWEGASSVDPEIEVMAYAWSWLDLETAKETVRLLPKEVRVLNVSEHHQSKKIQEIETFVSDYSISIEGPSDYSRELWREATKTGHKSVAKIQANNSWEMSSVPYIPVFEQHYRHISDILATGDIESIMYTWTLGGYPSPILEMIKLMCEKGKEIPSLEEIYEKIFAGADVATISRALHLFSEAFSEYPFCVRTAYYAPQTCAPANPLYAEPTGMEATMVCNPYDDLTKWRNLFPEEIFVDQMRKMSEKWNEGFELLKMVDLTKNPYLDELYDVADACNVTFRGMYNQCAFIATGRDEGNYEAVLEDEKRLAYEAIDLMARNATIGYESSNHYFYTKSNLMEKIVNCEYLAECLRKKKS